MQLSPRGRLQDDNSRRCRADQLASEPAGWLLHQFLNDARRAPAQAANATHPVGFKRSHIAFRLLSHRVILAVLDWMVEVMWYWMCSLCAASCCCHTSMYLQMGLLKSRS
jgi:hypothetical protein